MQPTSSLTRAAMRTNILTWLEAWDRHQLEGVLELMHEQVVFDNWTGEVITGKQALRRAWTPWFLRHGNFQFIIEDLFIDEVEQKALFQWQLVWPSLEKLHKGEPEIRRGVDVLHFCDGKMIRKYSYSKTTLSIAGQSIALSAAP